MNNTTTVGTLAKAGAILDAVETGPQGPFARDVPKAAVTIESAEILAAPAAAAPAAQPAPAQTPAQPASGG